jgi:hypothetical protein
MRASSRGSTFRNSDLTGSRLGRDVARFVAASRFRRVADSGSRNDREEHTRFIAMMPKSNRAPASRSVPRAHGARRRMRPHGRPHPRRADRTASLHNVELRRASHPACQRGQRSVTGHVRGLSAHSRDRGDRRSRRRHRNCVIGAESAATRAQFVGPPWQVPRRRDTG